MTRRQFLLGLIAGVSAALLVIVLTNPGLLRDPKPSADLPRWLASHPADWLAASAISDAALDSASRNRVELWRSAYAHAKRLAPLRPNTDAAFVRGGLFHWYELGPADRARVLRAAEPLMREPLFFERMHVPLWQLTRDFAWLRRTAPGTSAARKLLQSLAISRGLFAEYRALREELRRERLQQLAVQRANENPSALLDLLPQDIELADAPLVRGILVELDRKAFDPDEIGPRVEALLDFAVRHDVRPLTGLAPMLQLPNPLLREVTRARAALELNDAELATRVELTSAVPGNAEWDAYYLDRARFEARRGDGPSARAYIARAALGEHATLAVLAASEEIAKIARNAAEAASVHAELLQRAREPRKWTGACGTHELCNTAIALEYVAGNSIRLELMTTQSDETAPYVEILIDDARFAEGDVRDARVFEIPAAPGLHEVRVRLINTHTRNGTQRRVRLS